MMKTENPCKETHNWETRYQERNLAFLKMGIEIGG